MGRTLLIIVLVVLLMATGVAGADPAHETKLPIGTSEATIDPAPPDQVVVVRGDHLWKISARHVEATSPGLRIAPYWLEVIEENRPNLRSGDPDLIYPGEVIVLPELSGQP